MCTYHFGRTFNNVKIVTSRAINHFKMHLFKLEYNPFKLFFYNNPLFYTFLGPKLIFFSKKSKLKRTIATKSFSFIAEFAFNGFWLLLMVQTAYAEQIISCFTSRLSSSSIKITCLPKSLRCACDIVEARRILLERKCKVIT